MENVTIPNLSKNLIQIKIDQPLVASPPSNCFMKQTKPKSNVKTYSKLKFKSTPSSSSSTTTASTISRHKPLFKNIPKFSSPILKSLRSNSISNSNHYATFMNIAPEDTYQTSWSDKTYFGIWEKQ